MPPIDPKFIRDQILRFQDLPQFPGPAGRRELVNAFQQACETEAHVVAIANHLFTTTRFCPVPADVHKTAEHLAQSRAHLDTPSPFDEPGERDGKIGDQLSPEEVARWQALAMPAKDETSRQKAKRLVAVAILENFYKSHPKEDR